MGNQSRISLLPSLPSICLRPGKSANTRKAPGDEGAHFWKALQTAVTIETCERETHQLRENTGASSLFTWAEEKLQEVQEDVCCYKADSNKKNTKPQRKHTATDMATRVTRQIPANCPKTLFATCMKSANTWKKVCFKATNKEMIRGAGPGFGENCRRYFFTTNNETRVSGFL